MDWEANINLDQEHSIAQAENIALGAANLLKKK